MINCNVEKILISPKTIVEKYNIEKKTNCEELYSKYIRHFNDNYIYDGNTLYVIFKLKTFPELNDEFFVPSLLSIFEDAGYLSPNIEKITEESIKLNCNIES